MRRKSKSRMREFYLLFITLFSPFSFSFAYNLYRGDIHQHTRYSDGSDSAEVNIQKSKELGLDFCAITDHYYPGNTSWLTREEYEELKTIVERETIPHQFVAIPGFEWTSPGLHCNIFWSPHLFQARTKEELFQELNATPSALGQFNHPGSNDFYPPQEGCPRMCLMEAILKEGSSVLETFSYNLLYGWRCGATGTSDAHGAGAMVRRKSRTAVYASELTEEGLKEAFLARRCYATRDTDIILKFTASNYWMGSEFETTDEIIKFKVECNEVEGRKLELWYGKVGTVWPPSERVLGILATSEIGQGSWEYSYRFPLGDATYFFFVAVSDSEEPSRVSGRWAAISSPIWIKGNLQSTEFGTEKKCLQDFSYPNPLNPECWVPLNVKCKMQNVKCRIYNILGQLVWEIECSRANVQSLKIYWDGRDSRGLEVPAGVYFYEVDGEGVRKMVILK
jgi:hypothetical protein